MSTPNELLQQIVSNTTPAKATMISVSSTKPEFGINFITQIPVSEISLAQLRVYHSWPNVRSTSFGGLQSNNSFVFSYRVKSNGVPAWNISTLHTGSYQIEEINDEIQRQIKRITGKEAKINITAHEPTLSAVIEVSTPGYAVDIYNSSIWTVLGWPETKPPEIPLPVEPKKSDYISDKKSYHEITPSYMKILSWLRNTELTTKYTDNDGTPLTPLWEFDEAGKRIGYYFNAEHINAEQYQITEMYHEYKKQLKYLRESFQDHLSALSDPRSKFIKHVDILNQIIDDIEFC